MIDVRGRNVVASEPYGWPFSGDVTGERLAVVVTGASSWFTHSCPGWEAAAKAIEEVTRAVRSVGGLVVWTVHAGFGEHLPDPDDPAARLSVEVGAGDEVVLAGGLDAFYAGPLDALLRSRHRDQLVLAGAAFETTVHSTLRSANDRGYECLTLTDAAAVADENLADACASTICMSGGIFGAVARASDLISYLDSLEPKPCSSHS